ncbi:MAG: restriction endonuclease subunit S [Bacteroidales bacterium]|jgi:type I restriction enzyme S subunit|nr:restriction endonuclease subunit S [Bacteroidales bacterium]
MSGQEFRYIDLTSVNRENNQIIETKIISSENAPSRAQQIVETDDVIFGTTRPTLRRYCFITPDYDGQICSTGFCVLRTNKEIVLPKYLFYTLTTVDFYNYVENNQEGAGYPAIPNSKVMKYKLAIPSISEQNRIVAILDKFEALVNDISSGLPAEIAARKQQYEYYRNKLLTFKKVA